MPTWWGRKSSKSKQEEEQPHGGGGGGGGVLNFNFIKSPIRNAAPKKGKKPEKKKPNSFDDFTSPAAAGGGGGSGGGCGGRSSSGFSYCDSDGGEKRGLPLPRPSVSSTQSFSNDQGLALGSASISGSSVSSTGSCDDHPICHSQINGARGQVNVRSKSPGPGSRGPTSPTSPLHPRLHVLSLDSPTGRQEDGRSQCHPLPRPPGSPTSPSLSNTRANGLLENTTSNPSKWKKGKLLGRGTFGHVYLGFNSDSGHLCAIKEVRVVSDDQTSKECLKQLNQEISLLSQLSHPNIVQYYESDLGEEALSVYLEYVSGGSIHKLLQQYGAFKEPVIQNYTRQIVSGLAYLHGRNTVHRDIKGANILVDPNGEIKLADFGMAKHINASSSMLSFKGSPYWMAPEVVMNTNGYSLPVDIWSLGCTILEMAISKPPWSQYEGVAAIFKIGNSKDMPEIPDNLSNDAKNFIKLCLQRDPSARPTAQMLLDHPFIRDQSATKAANVRITRDAFPYMFDGSRTPPVLDHHSNRTSITSLDGDYATKPTHAATRAVRSPRDNTRMITSLPVSPCSSPLRQYGPAHKSCFLSPPHSTYTMMGQNTLSSYPVRSNATFTLDPWHETSLYKVHTPGGSPRTRLI
ncbi:mitogen-activated protein kinase kinase kinase 3-like [Gastrolobium bilobum]|uniref:mitogen-activated protein kinase kinase kinase 3-like n=1 Tax=Gastrolobium bilobum TaxID=150636 RepID=UPI002AAF7AF6|nr:mitogen-activated protein kinase kinase kinase 3-like [Gastrolobium bilobum]